MLRRVFGFIPSFIPTWAYNSIIAGAGCFIVADTLSQAFGLWLILESLLVSIERCWPDGERPE